MKSFFDFAVTGIHGEPDLLKPLAGKVVLAVNVASRCGLTPQYTDLEALHEELADEGFAVVGFPCNQFGAQEPGSEKEIEDFCSTTYGVTFPMSAKLEVNGPGRHPLYAWLTAQETQPDGPGDVMWNFGKFLVDKQGKVIARFNPRVAPEAAELTSAIEKALG